VFRFFFFFFLFFLFFPSFFFFFDFSLLIKLADYLIVETLHTVALRSTQDIQSKIDVLAALTDPSKSDNDPRNSNNSLLSVASSAEKKGKDFIDIDFIEPKDPKKPLFR